MDIRPLSLPVPSLLGKNSQRDHDINDTKAHLFGQRARESGSPLPQPLRFLANSVSISVNSSSKQEATSSDVPPETDAQKISETVDTCTPRLMVASCVCDTDVHSKLKRLFFLSIQRRFFSEWRRQQGRKQWKKISRAKDEQIVHLLDKLEESVGRMVTYCRKQSKRRLFRFWRGYSGWKKHEYTIEAKADIFSALKVKSRVYRRWRVMAMQGAWCRDVELHLQIQYQTSLQLRYFKTWYEEVQLSHQKNQEASRMESSRKKGSLVLFLAVWKHAQRLGSIERQVTQEVDQSVKGAAFGFWKDRTDKRKKCAEVKAKITEQRNDALLARVCRAWHSRMEKDAMSRLLRQCVFSIHMIQNLYVDNTRLASIVDSGKWGEEQIELLHAAADLLREEKQTLQNVLNQFPWSKDRRLYQSRNVQPRRNSTKKIDEAPCPEVFLRLSGKMPPKPISNNRECMTNQTPQSGEHWGNGDIPPKVVFEKLAMVSGMVHNAGGSIVTSITTENLAKADDMYKLMKIVNTSFETMGFSPSSN